MVSFFIHTVPSFWTVLAIELFLVLKLCSHSYNSGEARCLVIQGLASFCFYLYFFL